MSDPGVLPELEAINSVCSKKVAKKVTFPRPLKNNMKSHPVLIYNICITGAISLDSMAARSGSFLSALMRACISRKQCSKELKVLKRIVMSRSVLAMIGNPIW